MAAVSQHAMRRHPGSPLSDTATASTALAGPPINSAPSYYAVQHQQPLATSAAAAAISSPDKQSKKSWSQRLKITKNDKQNAAAAAASAVEHADMLNDHHLHFRPRSLNYADSAAATAMYYGTMRGQPAGMSAAAAQFYSPQPTLAAAIVLCSCADYLHGTKKDSKKPTLCKKCRGTRVPLSQFGGTVRLHPSSPMHHQSAHYHHHLQQQQQPPRSSHGTVRLMPPGVTAGGKQRPSILNLSGDPGDPYDMMRRSRLVSPELQPVNSVLKLQTGEGNKSGGGRTKSSQSSPLSARRSRSRSRGQRRSPSPKVQHNNNNNNNGAWVTEPEPSPSDIQSTIGRRSILHCDLSAYELIAKISHNNEFSPSANDDDDVYSMMPMLTRAGQQLQLPKMHSPPPDYGNADLDVTALAGQRINFASSKPASTTKGDVFVYDSVADSTPHSRRLNATLSPVRPPRAGQSRNRVKDKPASDSDGSDTPAAAAASAVAGDYQLTASVLTHISNDIIAPPPSQPHQQPSVVIKSILKRPSSIASDSQPSSLSAGGGGSGSDTDYGRTGGGAGADANIRSSRPKVCIALSKNTLHEADDTLPSAAATASSQTTVVASSKNGCSPTSSSMSSPTNTKEKRSSGSHFYLPMPQRKKVQFSEDTAPPSSAGETAAVGAPTEAYFGEHDQRHLHDIDIVVGSTASPTAQATTTTSTTNDGATGVEDEPLVSASTVVDLLIGGGAQQHQQQQRSNYSNAAHFVDYASASPPFAEQLTRMTGAAAAPPDSSTHVAGRPSASSSVAVLEILPSTSSSVSGRAAAAKSSALHANARASEATRSGRPTAAAVAAADAADLPVPVDHACSPSPPATPLQRRAAVRRERRRLSDPAVQVASIGHHQTVATFHDTTALRVRAHRSDSRTIFGAGSEAATNSGIARPKDPPPPPPPPASARSRTSPLTSASSPLLPNIDYEEIAFTPEASRSGRHEMLQGSRLFQPSCSAPALTLNLCDTSAVHRLQIRNEDPPENVALVPTDRPCDSAGAKKTSIMISGDDCYSTVNVSSGSQPMYHASVVVNGGDVSPTIRKTSSNTVSINVTTPVQESVSFAGHDDLKIGGNRSIIPIIADADAAAKQSAYANQSRTLITVDYSAPTAETLPKRSDGIEIRDVISNDAELLKMLRQTPIDADADTVQVPHVCGKHSNSGTLEPVPKKSPDTRKTTATAASSLSVPPVATFGDSFIAKLLEDPTLGHLAEGLDNDIVARLIENSLRRLKETRSATDLSGTKDELDMNRMIEVSLLRVREERQRLAASSTSGSAQLDDMLRLEVRSNRDSLSSANSFSSANYEAFDFDTNELSDCYQSCSSELTTDDDTAGQAAVQTRSKFYQMLVDATLSEIELSTGAADEPQTTQANGDDHHYESIRLNGDPIYEEINDMPPPLPLCPPPMPAVIGDADTDKKTNKSMFEGASKYDILSYLVDAKERGLVAEDTYTYNFSNTSDTIIIEEDISVPGINATLPSSKSTAEKPSERLQNQRNSAALNEPGSRISQASSTALSDDNSMHNTDPDEPDELAALKLIAERKSSSDIERNDSGVGSETSKNSRNKYQSTVAGNLVGGAGLHKNSAVHLCEDCDGPVETQCTAVSGLLFAPLVCRKCGKKRAERKEIVTEIIETEEKYGRDLQIILEEFYQPMLVAGLLTQEQLSAIFLNAEELLENSQQLADKMRDAFDIALEQGDDDLLTVNVGRLLLDAAPMLHGFESYCVRQAAASLLLANMEKEKELLRIFLRVSQMENTVLRRMNLNSFLMVPVQRVTKYPLLLARLYKVTPNHLDGRDLLRQAQEKIELHLNHMNREAKDVPTKLWRRISSSSPNRRSSCEIDMINIKLRKMAIDLLEWHHDEVRFPVEGKLLFTQPTDNNWRKGRTIKLTPVNALLVTNGKPSAAYKADTKSLAEPLRFPRHTGIREATLLLVREKSGRYTLLREPLFLDRCIVCTEADWEDYFELQEISSKETFIFKAEDGARTKQWYTQLQLHSQGMGAWRKRRNALANIMINGMMMRT